MVCYFPNAHSATVFLLSLIDYSVLKCFFPFLDLKLHNSKRKLSNRLIMFTLLIFFNGTNYNISLVCYIQGCPIRDVKQTVLTNIPLLVTCYVLVLRLAVLIVWLSVETYSCC